MWGSPPWKRVITIPQGVSKREPAPLSRRPVRPGLLGPLYRGTGATLRLRYSGECLLDVLAAAGPSRLVAVRTGDTTAHGNSFGVARGVRSCHQEYRRRPGAHLPTRPDEALEPRRRQTG